MKSQQKIAIALTIHSNSKVIIRKATPYGEDDEIIAYNNCKYLVGRYIGGHLHKGVSYQMFKLGARMD